MAQISIGQVENLEDAVRTLQTTCELAQQEANSLVAKAGEKVAEAEKEANNSRKMFEEAEKHLREAKRELQEAERNLLDAQNNLREAESDLSSCEVGGDYDEEGDFIPPDCSSEERNVASAEAELSSAEANFHEAQAKVEEAEAKLQLMQNRLELAEQTLSTVKTIQEAVTEQCRASLQKMEDLLETGTSRLTHARAALEAYLENNPDAKAFYDWLHWTKNSNEPISPQDLHGRFNLSPPHIREFMQYLSYRDPALREKIAGYRRELAVTNGPVERKLVLDKVRSNFSGYFAEKMAEYALKPLGTVKIHTYKNVENGKVTIVDIIVEDLKNPVILGRGKGMAAPKGGKIAVEVKSGQAAYLKAQQEHMVLQAKGHEEADASFTLCTRDIKDLPPESEEELREALRKAGSPIIGMLPKKGELDKAVWEVVIDGEDKTGKKEDHSK